MNFIVEQYLCLNNIKVESFNYSIGYCIGCEHFTCHSTACHSTCSHQHYVCGSDGRTYHSECDVERVKCETGLNIAVVKLDKCERPCERQCVFGAQCVNGMCVCHHIKCGNQYEPLCGSNGKTFQNSCLLRLFQCKTQQTIDIHYNGQCNQRSNELQCEMSKCKQFGGVCIENRCECEVECDDVKIEPVCGSNGQLYSSECHLMNAQCKIQTKISKVNSSNSCIKLCDGHFPLVNPLTNAWFECESAHDCPSHSYCHQHYCCQSMIDDRCSRCNRLGTVRCRYNRCQCKHGVRGDRCDRCDRGFHSLSLDGCTQCDCHSNGSIRFDCNQSSGECQCHPGYTGLKCDECILPSSMMINGQCKHNSIIKCISSSQCNHNSICLNGECSCQHIRCHQNTTSTMICTENNWIFISKCHLNKCNSIF